MEFNSGFKGLTQTFLEDPKVRSPVLLISKFTKLILL